MVELAIFSCSEVLLLSWVKPTDLLSGKVSSGPYQPGRSMISLFESHFFGGGGGGRVGASLMHRPV